ASDQTVGIRIGRQIQIAHATAADPALDFVAADRRRRRCHGRKVVESYHRGPCWPALRHGPAAPHPPPLMPAAWRRPIVAFTILNAPAGQPARTASGLPPPAAADLGPLPPVARLHHPPPPIG